MKKLVPLCALTLAFTCTTASAVVNLFLTTITNGSGFFDDTVSGGFSETLPNFTIVADGNAPWHAMNYPGALNYTSGGSHIDSASLKIDITQAAGMPFFQATGNMAQVPVTTATVSTLGYQFQSYFEGTMSGTPVTPALGLMGLDVSGTVGPTPGEYVDFVMKQFYLDSLGNAIGNLTWTYNNAIVGPFGPTTILPVWSGGPVLTDNLITVQGFITVTADPSSISFTPAPEPSSLACLLIGATALAARRRRGAAR